MVHRARKRFGQNFLQDAGVIDRIVAAIRPAATDHIVEIGPGRGALTEALLDTGARVTAIELDRDLPPILRARFFSRPEGQFNIVSADALKTRFAGFDTDSRGVRLVGNLPYNISTPLIFHALAESRHIRDMHFMLQKEVVERLGALPGEKARGRLSVMVQYACAVDPLLHVPPGAFNPQPKVDSAVVRLTPRAPESRTAQDEDGLSRLVRQAFGQRRKTLRNNLKGVLDDTGFAATGIDPGARPETLSTDEFVRIANHLSATTGNREDIPATGTGERGPQP